MLEGTPHYDVLVDKETGERLVAFGSPIKGTYTVLGPLVQVVRLQGPNGEQALVSDDGDVNVVQGAVPHWYGLPNYGVDAAANVDDNYDTVLITTKRCTNASIYVETNDAIISFDGGTTDHFFLDKDAGQVQLTGLDIPAGTTISGKNAVVGADYTNLRIAAW